MPNEAVLGPSMQESVNPKFLISFQSLNSSILKCLNCSQFLSLFAASIAASIAVSIAASGCRFWLPFCRGKSPHGIVVLD